jgi:hypothetical protein
MLDIIFWVVGGVVLMTVMYRVVPFRELSEKKPRLAFFPKYSASYSGDAGQVTSNLKAMGFAPVPGKPHLYTRGKPYGDFSAKSLKLHFAIEESEKRVKVYAPLMGVFFDTGDLWQVADNAIQASQP